jgi:hypothetical protein
MLQWLNALSRKHALGVNSVNSAGVTPVSETELERREGFAAGKKQMGLWLDTAKLQFWVFGQSASYTGSFCVFGPVLSSPAHGPPSLAMGQI